MSDLASCKLPWAELSWQPRPSDDDYVRADELVLVEYTTVELFPMISNSPFVAAILLAASLLFPCFDDAGNGNSAQLEDGGRGRYSAS